eukprot:4814810-Pyramimonas_sp.AAC.1
MVYCKRTPPLSNLSPKYNTPLKLTHNVLVQVDLSHAYTQRAELQQKIDAYRDLKTNTEMLMKEDSSKPIR